MQGGLDTNAYYAFGIPAYALLVGGEYLWARHKGVRAYGFADTLGSFSAGLGEVVIGLFLGPYLLWLYDFGYEHLALIRWPESTWVAWVPWVLAFFAADFCYWLYHRAGHTVGIFWAIHGVHHQSRELNVSTATRHPWLSDTYSFVFYIPVPLLGITQAQFFLAISIISFYALFIHSRVLHRPGFWLLTTPRTHIVHHATNPRYIGKNLGAMFTLWDRLFGTHVEVVPEDPPVLGTRAGYRTHDGAVSQWLHWRDLWDVARRAPRFRDKLRIFVAHPGGLPEGVEPPRRAREARPDAEIPAGAKAYAALQLGLVIGFAVLVLWFRAQHPLYFQISSAVFILWSTWTIGGLLDGRPRAVQHELLRVHVGLAGALLLLGAPAYVGLGVVAALAAAASAAWLLVPGLRLSRA